MTGFVVALVVALVALGGLGLDGASAESAHLQAATEAAQAARAGAMQLSQSLREGALVPDAGAAVGAAESWMAAAGHPGSAVVVANQVITTVSPYRVPTMLLSIIGIDSFTVSASASAIALSRNGAS